MIAAISPSKDKNLLHQKTLGHYTGRSLMKKTVTKFVSRDCLSYFFARMTLPRKKHRLSTEKAGYEWQEGARVTGESIVMGTEPRINVEHALHVLEIIEAARKSQQTGARIKLKSKFPWPIVK